MYALRRAVAAVAKKPMVMNSSRFAVMRPSVFAVAQPVRFFSGEVNASVILVADAQCLKVLHASCILIFSSWSFRIFVLCPCSLSSPHRTYLILLNTCESEAFSGPCCCHRASPGSCEKFWEGGKRKGIILPCIVSSPPGSETHPRYLFFLCHRWQPRHAFARTLTWIPSMQ